MIPLHIGGETVKYEVITVNEIECPHFAVNFVMILYRECYCTKNRSIWWKMF